MKKKHRRISHWMTTGSPPTKASEMILQVAGGFVAMVEDLQEKQNRLNLACNAWNLSLLPEQKRQNAIEQCIAEYRRMNSGVTEADCENVRHNYRVIIEQKCEMFPSSRKQMIRAFVEEVRGRHRVNVVSYDPDRQSGAPQVL